MGGFESLLDLPINEHFDSRYDPRELLGTGASGEVRAYYDRWMGREVALKALGPGATSGSTPQIAGRFFREARLQGQLEHPAVVPVHECSVDPEGRGYFTMKRVRGATLTEVLRRRTRANPAERGGSHGLRRLLEAFRSICLAVDFAHSHGVVHRDLKPSNIMLGDFGEVYLLDWGVAKVLGDEEQAVPSARLGELPPVEVTEQGSFMGTVGYMAPEQLQGGHVAVSADVYSLGAILFEVVTGQPLHPRNRIEAMRSTREGVEARPSVRFPELAVAPELDLVLMRATATKPADRYPTARALANEVERYLDGERDLDLRQKMAQQHLAWAQDAVCAMDQPKSDEVALQRSALRNVGHALALDPSCVGARELLSLLVLREPHTDPPEVKQAILESDANMRLGAAHILFRRSVIWLLCVPLTVWLGFIRPTMAIAVILSLVVSTGLIAWISRRSTVGDGTGLALLTLTSLLFALFGAMFGPFLVVPGLVTTNIIFFILYSEPRHRKYILLAGVLTLVCPYLAEVVGLLPESTKFLDGQIVIVPRVMAFPAVPTQVVLVVMHALLGVAPAMVATRVRDQLQKAERKRSLATWLTSQMVTDLWEHARQTQ